MWTKGGMYRDKAGLRAGLAQLEQWCVDGNGVADRETRNMLLLGKALLTAAFARTESRGAHFRRDFPETSAALQHQFVVQRPDAAQ
jgi:L-aspartate oxidase